MLARNWRNAVKHARSAASSRLLIRPLPCRMSFWCLAHIVVGALGETSLETMRSRPSVRIRDISEPDLATVLAINEESVPAMNSLTLDRMRWFVREAEYFRVAECDSRIAGFLICLSPEAPYESANFLWLKKRCEDFLYIDRVAVRSQFHRLGIASALYRDAAECARNRFRMIACEVNTRPRNRESIRFHRRLGFEVVGAKDHGYVEVQYMARPLPL